MSQQKDTTLTDLEPHEVVQLVTNTAIKGQEAQPDLIRVAESSEQVAIIIQKTRLSRGV